ncbi:DUF192 domain-containing protein [Sedimentitalea nanhaiensis]|uniref:DUF192 domain-containing protein n=1 Tax=Sedimentitalea nanhaiensis TaxID=999627 RepID=A0A1I7B9E9_9RHOB|nr:DUF192 domain-containing protein [Sedimentitalea nanhaiensis]SFT83805.1 hypothetical protein SAMN05216236_10927 [Sedimentitalea nanhaiensis]
MKSIVVAMLLLAWATVAAAGDCRSDEVWLRGDWGETRFSIELADTPRERSRGLMYRETMPRGAGMLFVYEQPQRASFWMKNTLIPLDMLFIDRAGTVTRVHHRAVPGDLTPIEGGAQVYAVLEINGGLAKTYGITAGSQVRHPVFLDGPAVWRC